MNIETLFENGAHYGYSKTRRHPSTAPFIFTTKNRIDIVDLEETIKMLSQAESFLKTATGAGKKVLFVGVKPESRKIITEVGEMLSMPYVNNRWVGGTLTNFGEIKRRIARLVDLREQTATGGLEKFTKKERLLISREIEKMDKNFSGLVSMDKVPDIMVVVDPKREHIAVTEAQKMGIPVVALANTDCNILDINYPIVANDGSVKSIKTIIEVLGAACK